MAYTYRSKSVDRRDREPVQEKTQVQYDDAGTVTDVSNDNPLPVELAEDSEVELKVGGQELVKGLVSLPVEDQRGNAALDGVLVELKLMNKYLSVLTNESFGPLDIERE